MRTLIASVLLLLSASAFADHNWSHSKRQVYARDAGTTTLYCGCAWQDKKVDLASCGYEPRKNERRAKRTEVEHIVPSSRFGSHLDCWKEGGREHCYRTDPQFRACHNDLRNLAVAVGEINGDRSNRDFGIVPGEPREYGLCNFEIDGVAEPPGHIRPRIARTYLYMAQACDFGLTDAELDLIWDWLK